ncbi:anthranilate synthase component I family protein [Spongiivirga citrea]|uniref:Aminodeoxychorismate synthase component I n=1 Tax=Spongiivirga citrea TaxID=1481457 RepID=A0A6M0CEW1_9FLAO|nr:anthranilate synthase component I family protein [Spongiivirga citrea]NER16356.1 aminodeoxychorismate synthase component I [Spongiivirga citrea]
MRSSFSQSLLNTKKFKRQLLQWAQQFDDVIWLDSNEIDHPYAEYDAILAVDAFTSLKTDFSGAFDQLKEYKNTTQDWIFGYLTYDLKNDVERLASKNHDGLGFADVHFFQPKKLFLLKGNTIELHYLRMCDDEMELDLKEIAATNIPSLQSIIEKKNNGTEPPVKIKLRIHKEAYYEKLEKLLAHIHRGDIYEANFCQEFYAEDAHINPIETYLNLNDISTPPFATFMKLDELYLLSASPERYLKKNGNSVISQPIKGTAKRSENREEDIELAKALKNDPKERSENVMIVDLVRNDLSKHALKGSVQVEELCEVYSFKQVHQMISTVTAKVADTRDALDVIEASFPMGSMTGAPKISAMNIIEELEETKRGIYSGAVGYFTPDDDFDFNVIIRSILYNSATSYVSYSVGGAITAESIPEKEYEECLIKAKAMRQVLEG